MSSDLLYKNSHHNCINLAVTAILLRMGVRVDYLWNQAALLMDRTRVYTPISPYYMEWTDYLRENHDLYWYKEVIPDQEAYIQRISELLLHNSSIGIEVDIYKLPYCIHYESVHDFHALEVLSIRDNQLEICDHYFHYYGFLEFEDLFHSLHSFRTHVHPNPSIFSFETNQNKIKKYGVKDLIQGARQNISIMKGEVKEDLFEKHEDIFYGIEAFSPIKKSLEQAFNGSQEEVRVGLVNLFYQFKEISHSRYNFHQFLNMYGQKNVASEYLFVANSWSVAANLLIRAQSVEEHMEFFPRVMKRLESIFKKEVEIIHVVEQMLEKLES